jgi:hypothetical protein
MKKHHTHKHKQLCDKSQHYEDCELTILREAVDRAEEIQGQNVIKNPEIKKIITIVEDFIRKKKLICYGGTAINNILPKEAQFYNRETEIPDYDFFSTNALEDAKELTDIYAEEGFLEVEAKSGQHKGTYKVFVNFIPTADITHLSKDIFIALKKDAIKINGIYYAPPNFLRMSMFLELSRPAGDVSRWEKVLKRLTLLNKYYPLKGHDCDKINIQREISNAQIKNKEEEIFYIMRKALINQGVVFIGGYAISLYSRYMPIKKLKKYPDFDVITEDPKTTAKIVKEQLEQAGIHNLKIVNKQAIGELIAPHIELKIGQDTLAFIYEPIACYSYNVIHTNDGEIKVGTIDTILSFYLAFLYSNKDYYDSDRLLCIAQYLFEVQQHNRLAQKGLLKRFSIKCYGHQNTIEELREEKANKYNELKDNKNSKEFEEWFLRYRPNDEVLDIFYNNKKPKSEFEFESKVNTFKKTKKERKIGKSISRKRGSIKKGFIKRGLTKKNFIKKFLFEKRNK